MANIWRNTTLATDPENGLISELDELPACTSCRRRKLRCTRERPSCSHCQRLRTDCAYEGKQKPGIKNGAVAALSRRLEVLEQILLDASGQPIVQFTDDGQIAPRPDPRIYSASPGLEDTVDIPDSDISLAQSSRDGELHPETANAAKKRKHHDITGTLHFNLWVDQDDTSNHLPQKDVVVKLVDFFCLSFHHWIPFWNKPRLQACARSPQMSKNFQIFLHAVVAVTLRFMDCGELYMNEQEVQQQISISRTIATNAALGGVAPENLQALIIMVFDYLNSGLSEKAWPLIGSLTRLVDCLQLNVEPSPRRSRPVMGPLQLLEPSSDWTVIEERRRLFWVVFLLDRYVSVNTGWNTTLTSEDVRRRLPADGGYFTREEPVTTPYFGLWTKSAAKIGLPLKNLGTSQYKDDEGSAESVPATSPDTPGSAGMVDASTLGAFAYCIEATESLSQVTTFFLQQAVDWNARKDTIEWLMRFKELDLRLVQWKLFLPAKWKDSNISQSQNEINMDPNLTLAHITHNTSMILLHHPVAYPKTDMVPLPSACSIETCVSAAVETSRIADRFLLHTQIPFVNAQFAFCVFVAAKALLMASIATKKALLPEFEHLMSSLWKMSANWMGEESLQRTPSSSLDQAGKYAHHLRYLHESSRADTSFRFDLLDHSCRKASKNKSSASQLRARSSSQASKVTSMGIPPPDASGGTPHEITLSPYQMRPEPALLPDHRRQHDQRSQRRESASTAAPSNTAYNYYPPIRNSSYSQQAQTPIPFNHTGLTPELSSVDGDMLMNLSNTLMNPQFMEMDRVITYNDANFFVPGDGWYQ